MFYAVVSVANAFVSSRLDYCNSLFRSLSKFNLHKLQSIQNSAARIVTNSSKYTRITQVLRKLHWPPVQFHSEFKLATWCTSLFILASRNILLHIYPRTTILTILDAVRVLPISLMFHSFTIHKFTKQFGFSFAFDAPTVWNSLPEDIHASPTIASFGTKLKLISTQ